MRAFLRALSFRMLALALILTLLAAPQALAATKYATLEFGSRGSDVLKLQKALLELGFNPNGTDGKFGRGTETAVKAYQAARGLEADGKAGTLTLTKLYAETDGQSATVTTPVTTNPNTLKYGDSGSRVTELQTALVKLGYNTNGVDGRFGAGTQRAVISFQKDNGLEADGLAGTKTLELLYKKADGTSSSSGSSSGSGTSSGLTRTLRRGYTGDDVITVQQRLKELGYYTGPVSGNFLGNTLVAVKAFQEQNGLEVDGIVGEMTWNMLFNSSDVLDISATARPTPVPTPVPYAITVDVRNQVTTVYGLDENGEYTVPVKQMVCSTGMKATPSDVGEWVLNGRKARWCYFPTWGSHAQYWTRINENIAFHSVIYNTVDLNNMSTKSYNLLGSRASHGCIRLLVSDAKWIYDNVGEGVVVTVTEDEIAAAILALIEKQKLIAEGAGAVSVAAAMFGKLPIAGKKAVCLVSGGNIDVNILSRVITRGLVTSGRNANLLIALEDKPGQLVGVSEIIAACGANVVGVRHERSDPNMAISSCFLRVSMETRDFEQIAQIRAKLTEAGFQIVN